MPKLDKLVKDHIGLVTFIAKKHQHRHEPIEDLIQIGLEALLKASKRFNKKYGVKFSTYASPTIDGEIRHYLRDKISSVKISRKLIELNTKVNQYKQLMMQKTGIEPTFGEVSRALKIPMAKILHAVKAVEDHFTLSIDNPLHSDSSKTMHEYSLEEILHEGCFEERLINKEILKNAFKVLSPREREIIHQHFFEDQIQSHLSKRFGITQAQISRIIHQAVAKMRSTVNAG